jgi:ABC-type transporter Mla subunit MlaD
LAVLTLYFLACFLYPAIRQRIVVGRCARQVGALKSHDLVAIDSIFNGDSVLSHLWGEFKDTLHAQKELDATGTYHVTAVRQTVPAETYFSEQALVHSPLRVEFFKHLPGILTGLGIIATFTGLIAGLQGFDPSGEPSQVQAGLSSLLESVSHAFIISAIAITLAMVVTGVEKWFIAGLYKRVEILCLNLDCLFEAGVGEDYLSRLVQASESSAKEARQLKQALVDDLKRILEEVTERQIQAQAASTENIAKGLASGIKDGLEKPLNEISAAVQHVSGNQGEAVSKLLTDTLAAMTAQIRDLFSGQVDGIRGMQQQTIDSLQSAVGELKNLLSDISQRGKETSDVMSAQLASTISAMELRQREMTTQTQILVDTLRAQAEQSRKETSEETRQLLEKMAGTVGSAVAGMTEQSQASISKSAHLTEVLVRQTAESASAIRQAVATMSSGTNETVSQMNQGAAEMLRAAQQLAQFGASTGEALNRAQGFVEQLTRASGTIGSSADSLRTAIDDHKAARDTLGAMVQQLAATVENAKREATLTADVLHRIEAAAQGLKGAQEQADKYLQQVSEVLEQAHQEFGDQVISTLASVNGEFHKHLEQSTKALSGAIDELDAVVERIGDR